MADTITTGSSGLRPDIQNRLLSLEQAIQRLEDQFKSGSLTKSKPKEDKKPSIIHTHPDWLKIAAKVSIISLAAFACLMLMLFFLQSGIGGLEQLVDGLELHTLAQPWV